MDKDFIFLDLIFKSATQTLYRTDGLTTNTPALTIRGVMIQDAHIARNLTSLKIPEFSNISDTYTPPDRSSKVGYGIDDKFYFYRSSMRAPLKLAIEGTTHLKPSDVLSSLAKKFANTHTIRSSVSYDLSNFDGHSDNSEQKKTLTTILN